MCWVKELSPLGPVLRVAMNEGPQEITELTFWYLFLSRPNTQDIDRHHITLHASAQVHLL